MDLALENQELPLNYAGKEKHEGKSSRKFQSRRYTPHDSTFNVRLSKLPIPESSRVLRSKSRLNNSTIHEKLYTTYKINSILKEHSYSKVEKRTTKFKMKPVKAIPRSIEKNADSKEEEEEHECKNKEQLTKIEEFKPSSIPKFQNSIISIDKNSNDPSENNQNGIREIVNEGLHTRENQQSDTNSTPGLSDDSLISPKYEKIFPAKDYDPLLFGSPSQYQPSQVIAEPVINTTDVTNQTTAHENTSMFKIYFDLDINEINISTADKTETLCSVKKQVESSVADLTNYPSGGSFQKLNSVVTSTSTLIVTKPKECYQSMASSSLYFDPPYVANPTHGMPNFQQVFHEQLSFSQSFNSSELAFSKNFTISGGSIERLTIPVVPYQQPIVKENPDIGNQNPIVDLTQFECQNDPEPECRIHLVDTPPSFTRSEVVTMIRKPPELSMQQPQTLFSLNKPRRNRRTRAQMDICREQSRQRKSVQPRQEIDKKRPRNTNYSVHQTTYPPLEYHRVQPYPTMYPSYTQPQVFAHNRYPESLSSYSHVSAQFESHGPPWLAKKSSRNFNYPIPTTTANYTINTQTFHNQPTFISNQEMGFMQPQPFCENLQTQTSCGICYPQTAYESHQSASTSSFDMTERSRPLTPCSQIILDSLATLSPNLLDMVADQMQYF